MQPSRQGIAAWGRVLGLAALIGWTGAALAQEKVSYNMAWLPQGSSVGVIVAQELGYFKEAGLDVNIQRGYGGNRTANELDQGQYEFGYVDPISLVLNRANGGKIRMVGALNTRWPAGICFDTKRHRPKTPADMKGLLLGGGSASPVHNVVPAWLELNGQPRTASGCCAWIPRWSMLRSSKAASTWPNAGGRAIARSRRNRPTRRA